MFGMLYYHDLAFKVSFQNMRMVEGQKQYYVEPVSGQGGMWVDAGSIIIGAEQEDEAPTAAQQIDGLMIECHVANRRWWKNLTTGEPITTDQPHLVGEKLMLIVSEIAEAMEGHRKNLDDAHLPVFKSIEVELADAMIRIFDLSAAMGLRLGEAFVAKMAYNAVREDHTEAARRAEGGKKY